MAQPSKLKARTLDRADPSALDGFSCGTNGDKWADAVHMVVAQLRVGVHPWVDIRVAESTVSGRLVGVAAIGQWHFKNPAAERIYGGSPYLTVIGVSASFRGKDARGGGPPLGDFLMADALAFAKRRSGGKLAPWVFSLVNDANVDSVKLHTRNGFVLWRPAANPQFDGLFRRARGLELPSADPDLWTPVDG